MTVITLPEQAMRQIIEGVLAFNGMTSQTQAAALAEQIVQALVLVDGEPSPGTSCPDLAALRALLARWDRMEPGLGHSIYDALHGEPPGYWQPLREMLDLQGECGRLREVAEAARQMPRATPAPGGASTEHTFTISAGAVWTLDRALQQLDAALQGPEQ
jgi:hypothetical protein